MAKNKKKKQTVPDKDGHYDIDGVSYKDEHIYLGSDKIKNEPVKSSNKQK